MKKFVIFVYFSIKRHINHAVLIGEGIPMKTIKFMKVSNLFNIKNMLFHLMRFFIEHEVDDGAGQRQVNSIAITI